MSLLCFGFRVLEFRVSEVNGFGGEGFGCRYSCDAIAIILRPDTLMHIFPAPKHEVVLQTLRKCFLDQTVLP